MVLYRSREISLRLRIDVFNASTELLRVQLLPCCVLRLFLFQRALLTKPVNSSPDRSTFEIGI